MYFLYFRKCNTKHYLHIYLSPYLLLFPVLQEVEAREAGSDAALDEDTPINPDLTAGKKDVFLVDVWITKLAAPYFNWDAPMFNQAILITNQDTFYPFTPYHQPFHP